MPSIFLVAGLILCNVEIMLRSRLTSLYRYLLPNGANFQILMEEGKPSNWFPKALYLADPCWDWGRGFSLQVPVILVGMFAFPGHSRLSEMAKCHVMLSSLWKPLLFWNNCCCLKWWCSEWLKNKEREAGWEDERYSDFLTWWKRDHATSLQT